MREGLTGDLFWAAFWVGLACMIILKRELSPVTSILISVVKVGFSLAYFAWYFDGTTFLGDDIIYQAQGEQMLRDGYNPMTALLNPDGIARLFELTGGFHILYGWWNLLGQYLFGEHYYSAVFLNVWLTVVCGILLVRMLEIIGFDHRYQKSFLIFFLFHWEILVWSSFINLKDIATMTLAAWSLLLFLKLAQKLEFRNLAWLGVCLGIFSFVRFYMPVLILASAGIWLLLKQRDIRKWMLIPIIVGMLYLSASSQIDWEKYGQQQTFFFSLFKLFLLSPPPWKIDTSYPFLLIPSILHWIFFIPAMVTGVILWQKNITARLLIIYMLLVTLFYTLTIFSGPRQRLQITFVIAWLQFHTLWLLVGRARRASSPRHPR